jgi:hypothetical protein
MSYSTALDAMVSALMFSWQVRLILRQSLPAESWGNHGFSLASADFARAIDSDSRHAVGDSSLLATVRL